MTGEATYTDSDIARIAARIDRPIVLVGLMGAGKSTVGRKLATMIGRVFVEANVAIVEDEQTSI